MGEIEVTLGAHEKRIERIEQVQSTQAEVVTTLREGFAGLKAEMKVWITVFGIIAGFVAPVITGVIVAAVTRSMR